MFEHPGFYIALLILNRKMDGKQMAELGKIFLPLKKKRQMVFWTQLVREHERIRVLAVWSEEK